MNLSTQNPQLAVVLVEPRIPQNVGNIGRLCACTGCELLLVGDLGFSFNQKYLKRAGMDYLEHLSPKHYPDFPQLLVDYPDWTVSFFDTGTTQVYTHAPFTAKHLLVFGSEDNGLPQAILQKYAAQSFTIPMLPNRRSLNLSTSVGVVVYEALRQLGF